MSITEKPRAFVPPLKLPFIVSWLSPGEFGDPLLQDIASAETINTAKANRQIIKMDFFVLRFISPPYCVNVLYQPGIVFQFCQQTAKELCTASSP
jgi:hypothetical protein